MKRYGVLPSSVTFPINNPLNNQLKQYYLLFDGLTFGPSQDYIKLLERYKNGTNDRNLFKALDYHIKSYLELIDKGILVNVNINKEKVTETNIIKADESTKEIATVLKDFKKIDEKILSKKLIEFDDFSTRLKSTMINEQHNELISFPVVSKDSFTQTNTEIITHKEEIINVILSKFPVIDSSISWNRIFDFKNDSDSFLKLNRLINWTNEISKENLTSIEISQKLEYLILEYENALNLHEMKYHISMFQLFILKATETIENLLKLNVSKVFAGLCDIKKQKIEMLEEERKLPGSEIAYFIKAQREFS